MGRALRSNELTSDLLIYYNFDLDFGQPGLEVTDRSGNEINLFLGYEDIGSQTIDTPVYLRSAPLFVSSEAPIFESRHYITLTRYFGMTTPNFQRVKLPFEGASSFDSSDITTTILTIPDEGIIVTLLDGTPLTFTPYNLSGNEVIVAMANKDVLPLEVDFTYRISTPSRDSAVGTIMMRLIEQQPPSPGGAGHTLMCDG